MAVFYSCNNNPNKASNGDWKLVWSDEFDYTGLPDSTKWSYDTEGNAWGWGNNEKQFYTKADKRNGWVENGMLAYPVDGITIAGNLKAMFQGIEAVGNDVDPRSHVATGSILLGRMTVAGSN